MYNNIRPRASFAKGLFEYLWTALTKDIPFEAVDGLVLWTFEIWLLCGPYIALCASAKGERNESLRDLVAKESRHGSTYR